MAPSKNARKSVTIPPRLTLELISDIFQVMLENMGMTESCIVEYMTSSKGFQASQMVQLKQALKLAVDMGLVTFRDDRYMFTMSNLENMIEHKQERMEEDVDASPASTLPGPDAPSDRCSLAAVADYIASSDHHAALAASLSGVRRGAKRSVSHCPTPLAKRACVDAAVGVALPRACRGHYKPFRSDVPTPVFPRSSTPSVRSKASSGADTLRGIRNPRQTKRASKTRRYVSKYVAQKSYRQKAKPGRPSMRNSIEPRKRGRPPKDKSTAGKVNTYQNRGRKTGKCKSAEPLFAFDDPMPSTSAGRGGKKAPSFVSTDDSEYYAPKAKRRKSDGLKSLTSKHSLVSTSTAKTASSRNTASTLGSKKSKAPSKTSRKSSDGAVADRERRMGTTSLLKEYLESSFMKKTCGGVQDSGSSVGSKGSGRLSKTSSKMSLNSVATPPDRVVERTLRGSVGRPKAITAASLRKSFAGASLRNSFAGASLLPKDSGSSVESRVSSRASKASTKTGGTEDATPPPDGDAPRKFDGRKRKLENTGARMDAKTTRGARNAAGSSVASKSSNASKVSSKTSVNTDDTTESVRNTRRKKSETTPANAQKPQRKSVKPKVSATSTATKSSNVSKTSSRTSCNTEDSADSAHSTKKPEPNPANQTSGAKSQNSDSSIGSKGSNVSKASSKTSCNTAATGDSVRSTRNKKPGDVTASQKSLRNSSNVNVEAQKAENRKSAAADQAALKSSCKLEKPAPDEDIPPPKTTRNSVKASSSEAGATAPQNASASSSTGAMTSFARTVKLPRGAAQQADKRNKPTSKSSREMVDAGASSTRGSRRATRCGGGVAMPNKQDGDDDEEDPDKRTMHDFYT